MEKKRKVWIISGESSGDLYGARLAQDLWKKDPSMEISGMGGVRMRSAGVNIMVDSTELGVIGIVEVLGILFKIIRIGIFLLKKAKEERPDAVILIDYPGFNIRLAKRLKKMNIPVIWYISPQVWVWRKSNIPKYATYCKKLIVIFPFEPEVWKGSGLDTEFAGHPLMEVVQARWNPEIQRDPRRVLILPGSRTSETSRLVEPFMHTVCILKQRNPQLKFAMALPRQRTYDEVMMYIEKFRHKNPDLELPEIDISVGTTARWMQEASAGLAASGTVTVESAISDLPLTVAYKLNPITFLMGRIVIRKLFRGFFTMVNIILDKKVFEEFLQKDVVPSKMADAVEAILPGGTRREEVMADMQRMRDALSSGMENATHNAAQIILNVVEKCKNKQ